MDGLYPIIRRVRRPLVNMATKQRAAAWTDVLKRLPSSKVETASVVPVAEPVISGSVISEQIAEVQQEATEGVAARTMTRATANQKERHGRKAKEA